MLNIEIVTVVLLICLVAECASAKDSRIIQSPYPDMEIPDTDVWSFLAARLRNGKPCYIADIVSEKRYYNAEIADNVEQIAAYFQSVGIGPGKNVLFLAKNTALAAISYLAIFATGATAVPISLAWSTSNDDFCSVATMTGCTYCVCDSAFSQHAIQFTQKIPNVFKTLFLINSTQNGFVSIEKIITNNKMQYKKPIVDSANDIALYLFTSGTTGLPKTIMHTHHNVLTVIVTNGLSQMALINDEDVFFCIQPIMHTSGTSIFLSTLAANGSIVYADRGAVNADNFVEIVHKFTVTNMCGFPAAFGHLIKSLDELADLSSFKTLVFSGSSIGDSLSQLALKRFPNLTSMRNAYAMSEIMSIITSGLPGTLNTSTCGVPHPNNRIKIIDTTTGECLERNKTGEILVWSDGLMKGYLNNEKETEVSIEKDGFFHSGDLGYIDENGNLRIVGRIKEMIKCLDSQVSPVELENILLNHEAVQEAVIVGVPSEEYGEAPAACVVLNSNFSKSEELKTELISLVKQRKPRPSQQLYGGVHFFDNLPKTSSGKYLKKELIKIISKNQSK